MGGGTATSASVLLLRPDTPTGAGYSIDVEHAPEAIANLRRAAQALTDEARKASDLASIVPPGLDVVSAHAVQVFADVAAGEHGSLRLALLGAATRFQDEADKLEASLRTYLHTDEISIPVTRNLTGEGEP
ncbi:MAG: hypothetical protein ACRDRV_19145 [Pseudonocardiaceae bacterium]